MIIIEYNENGQHHTSQNGADDDWYKEFITVGDGYKILNFKQVTKNEIKNDTDLIHSTIYFIVNHLIPEIIKED